MIAYFIPHLDSIKGLRLRRKIHYMQILFNEAFGVPSNKKKLDFQALLTKSSLRI